MVLPLVFRLKNYYSMAIWHAPEINKSVIITTSFMYRKMTSTRTFNFIYLHQMASTGTLNLIYLSIKWHQQGHLNIHISLHQMGVYI